MTKQPETRNQKPETRNLPMLQPFEHLTQQYLARLIELKKQWLVTQSYAGGIDPFSDEKKIPILFTDYDDLETAKTHWNAVRNDRFASIIDLEKPAHRQKLDEMMRPISQYQLFWSVVKSVDELETRINAKYSGNMRRYIENNTKWKPGGDQSLTPSIQIIFGEVFIILKYQNEVLKVKFEEIERS
jgi:hypothetical protein